MDQHDWVRAIDHSNYYCRSTQRLWIHPRVVQYIRIVGTNNTVNKCFHTVSMEIMYNSEEMHLVDIEKGLVGMCILMYRIKIIYIILLLIMIRFAHNNTRHVQSIIV